MQMLQRLKHKSKERNARVELAKQLKMQDAESRVAEVPSMDEDMRLSLDLKRIA